MFIGTIIDLGNEEWVPIGNAQKPFKGTLDGNGFKISNLKIKESNEAYIGLFGYASGATFENVIIENVDILTSKTVGALVGYINGTKVTKCAVTGEGLISVTSAYLAEGGLIGEAYNKSTINKSFSTIKIRGGYQPGGFIGWVKDTSVIDCFSTGRVDTGSPYVGGFIGNAYNATIENCYYAGQVFGNSRQGIIGNNSSSTIINSYFDSTITDLTTPLENARTTSEMMSKSTFVGWDFDNTWGFDSQYIYPYLKENNILPQSGKGSILNPYLIENKTQLKQIVDDLYGYYKLTADIDLGNEEWVPIGNSSKPFKGTLDGNGFKISNLKIKESNEAYIGLFGYAFGATFENVIIENIDILTSKTVGALVGSINGTKVTKCAVTGEGLISVTSAYLAEGGLIGEASNKSTINKSFSTIKIRGGYQEGTEKVPI